MSQNIHGGQGGGAGSSAMHDRKPLEVRYEDSFIPACWWVTYTCRTFFFSVRGKPTPSCSLSTSACLSCVLSPDVSFENMILIGSWYVRTDCDMTPGTTLLLCKYTYILEKCMHSTMLAVQRTTASVPCFWARQNLFYPRYCETQRTLTSSILCLKLFVLFRSVLL